MSEMREKVMTLLFEQQCRDSKMSAIASENVSSSLIRPIHKTPFLSCPSRGSFKKPKTRDKKTDLQPVSRPVEQVPYLGDWGFCVKSLW